MKPVMVFDFGGVLLDWNPRYLYSKLFVNDPAGMERFLEEIDFYNWNHQQDHGRPFSEGVSLLSAAFPHWAEMIAVYFQRYPESLNGAIQSTVKILHTLKEQDYPLCALSNWAIETYQMVEHQYDFFHLFDHIILSGAVGICKPDPRIYHMLFEHYGRPAQDFIFIDDGLVNVESARELGIDAIHFQSGDQLNRALLERGFLLNGALTRHR